MKAHLSFLSPLGENHRKNVRFPDPNSDTEAESRDRGGGWKKSRSRWGVARDGAESPEADPVSSVSDTSPEEDVAMCLMMLCRNDGRRNRLMAGGENGADSGRAADTQKKVHQCEICKKCFRSSQALGGHRIIHRRKVAATAKEKTVVSGKRESSRSGNHECGYTDETRRIFECPFCRKVFGSGQALGGHKRSHLMGGAGRWQSSCGDIADGRGENVNNSSSSNSRIDLNLPAPTEDEDVCSVVSDEHGGGTTSPLNKEPKHKLQSEFWG